MECISFFGFCEGLPSFRRNLKLYRKNIQLMKFLNFFFAISDSDPHDNCRCILYLTPVHGDPGDHQGREQFPDPGRSASGFYSQ
jgi:hypothetical protein